MTRRLAWTGSLLFALLTGTLPAQAQRNPSPPSSNAQDGVQVSTKVSAQEVEVGERIIVSVTALATQGGPSPSSPQLPVQGEADVHGPSVRTEFRMFTDGSTLQRQQGLTATWTITPQEPGTITIGPGTFQVGGSRVSGERIVVKVQASSGTPRRSPPPSMRQGRPWPDPFDFDPFDWFRRRQMPNLDKDPFQDLMQPRVPAELRVDEAPDPMGFARMVVSPRQVVVGEQVLLKIFSYGGRGLYNVGIATQPATADFLSYPVEQDDLTTYRVPIGDSLFTVRKIRELVLIPLKTGELTIGATELLLSGRGYFGSGAHGGFRAKSEPLQITVVEPPLAGRPPGYVIGDVGRYTLDAQVEPRQVNQGDWFAVTAHLKGIGNVPSRLTPAENPALEWHEPSVSGQVEAQGTSVGGERVFRWTVRAKSAGTIDLGELRLPYYDAERRRYEVASVQLGSIEVAATDAAKNSNDTQHDQEEEATFTQLVPRTELGPTAGVSRHWADHPSFWWSLFGVPLSLPVLGGLERGFRFVAARRRQGRSGGRARVKSMLAEAAQVRAQGDLLQAASVYERAVYEAIELATSLKARGVLRARLASELQERGLAEPLARETASVIDGLETLRFTGQGDGALLAQRAEDAVRSLLSQSPRRAP